MSTLVPAHVADPYKGRRTFGSNWQGRPTVGTPPAVIEVREQRPTADLGEVVDVLGPLTVGEGAELRKRIPEDAGRRLNVERPPDGKHWNQWCYETGLRYGPAFAAGVFSAEDVESLVNLFVKRAGASGWNEREAEAGIRRGLRAAVDMERNFTVRVLREYRTTLQAAAMTVAGGSAGRSGGSEAKSAIAVLAKQVEEKRVAKKVLWRDSDYHTMRDVSHAVAAYLAGYAFEGAAGLTRMTTVGLNAREHRYDDTEVRNAIERAVIVLQPQKYVHAPPKQTGKLPALSGTVGGDAGTAVPVPAAVTAAAPKCRPDGTHVVPNDVGMVQTMMHIPGPRGGEGKSVPVSAWTAKGLLDAAAKGDAPNASFVLQSLGADHMEHYVWVPVPMHKWHQGELKANVAKLLQARDGLTFRRLRGVLYGPQILASGTVVTETGYHTTEGGETDPRREVAFVDVGAVAGLVNAVPLSDAIKEVREYIDTGVPYETGVDGSVAASLAFTSLSRAAYRLAPIFYFDAPERGSGKTYTAEQLTGLGGVPAVSVGAPPGSKDAAVETQKRIETAAVDGGNCFLFMDDLDSFEIFNVSAVRTLTTKKEGVYKFRILGTNTQAVVDPGKLTFVTTGHNLIITDDLARRVLRCRLDREAAAQSRGWSEAKSDAMHKRIKDDPAVRARLLSSMLTVLTYVRQRDELSGSTVSNFEDWSWLCGEAALLVMGTHPKAAMDRAKARDPKAAQHREMVEAVHELIRTVERAEAGLPATARRLVVDGYMLARDIANHFCNIGVAMSFAAQTGVGAAGVGAAGGAPDYLQTLRLAFDAEMSADRVNRTAVLNKLTAWLTKNDGRPTEVDPETGVRHVLKGSKMRDPSTRKELFFWRVERRECRAPAPPQLPWATVTAVN